MPWKAEDKHECQSANNADALRCLHDEFIALDNLINRRIQGLHAKRTGSQFDPFKGLVISDEEIAGLLQDPICLLDEPLKEAALFDRECHPDNQGATLSKASRLSSLARRFHLTPFEERCLMICLAPEVDRKYERLYGYLQDDLTRKKASIGLILDLLCAGARQKIDARQAFDPRSPLFKYRLLRLHQDRSDESPSFLARPLCIDERIANFILGLDAIDVRLQSSACLYSADRKDALKSVCGRLVDWPNDIRERMQVSIDGFYCSSGRMEKSRVLHIHGPYGAGKKTLALSVCCDLGVPLLMADLAKLMNGKIPPDEALLILGREAVLQSAALCLENVDPLIADEAQRGTLDLLVEIVRLLTPLTFLTGEAPWKPRGLLGDVFFTAVALPTPDNAAAKTLWGKERDKGYCIEEEVDFAVLAGQFRFTPGQIRDAFAAAHNLARWRSPKSSVIAMGDLYAACRDQCNPKLSLLARKIEPKYSWQDLVLSAAQLAQLQELCNQARYRHVVYGDWGFEKKLSYGKGLAVLFAGPPGTGKTMAAEVIANELRLDLYKIDLSQIVSKYIGETEKNLDKIFTEAQTSNAILFFDEADALFGKRSEVKDAHDRYANIEISYLLQKMEEYEGIAILSTNLRGNLDEAFVRRLNHVVEFPLPDENERCLIWKRIWPAEAPTDTHLDFEHMARSFEITGGNIRNIALAAAFMAADNGGKIEMSHLLRATRREYQKMGKILMDGQFEFQRNRKHPEFKQ
jgi:hypothetical protein